MDTRPEIPAPIMATLKVIVNAVCSSAVGRRGSLLEELSWTRKEVYLDESEGIWQGFMY